MIGALGEVANAVAKLDSLRRQDGLSRAALAAAAKASALAGRAYRAGLSDSLDWLNADLALLSERQQTAQLGARELDAYVGLMAALGGGM